MFTRILIFILALLFLPVSTPASNARRRAVEARNAQAEGSGGGGGGGGVGDLWDNLTAYWPLSESSGTRADSVGSVTLSPNNGGPGSTTGFSGTAADFEAGNGHFLSAADSASTSFTGDFSARVVVTVESLVTAGPILQKDSGFSSGNSYALWYSAAAGTFRFQVTDNNGHSATVDSTSLGTPALATPYQIIVRHRAGVNIGIQVDTVGAQGTEQTTAYTSGTYNGSGNFAIGSGDNAFYYDGTIEDVALWSKVLTSTHASTLWNSGSFRTYP